MLRVVLVLYDALLGFALLFAPWSRIWQENWLFWNAGSLKPFLLSGPVRGAVSGFGAAFLLRAAGLLAGMPVVEDDDTVSPGPKPGEDGDTAHPATKPDDPAAKSVDPASETVSTP